MPASAPGAYSFIGGVRSRNTAALDEYCAEPGRKTEVLALSEHEIRTETLIQHFRLARGLDKAAYGQRFGRNVREDFGAPLDGLIVRGLLEEDAEAIRPTPKGFALNDEIGLALVT